MRPLKGTIVVTRRVHFNAAHRLHNPEFSDAWNKSTYGPCNNPNWHGHNYELEVPVIGEPDPRTGYVMESLMAAVAQGSDEAKARVRAFLDKRAAKVERPS